MKFSLMAATVAAVVSAKEFHNDGFLFKYDKIQGQMISENELKELCPNYDRSGDID